MDKALMKKWIKALRSGKYKQGQRRLRTFDGKFCCLGVLCDISGMGKWTPSMFDGNNFISDSNNERCAYIPPYDVLAKAGIDYPDATDLATKNDIEGYTFEEIAEVLECILFFEE